MVIIDHEILLTRDYNQFMKLKFNQIFSAFYDEWLEN